MMQRPFGSEPFVELTSNGRPCLIAVAQVVMVTDGIQGARVFLEGGLRVDPEESCEEVKQRLLGAPSAESMKRYGEIIAAACAPPCAGSAAGEPAGSN